MKDAFHRHKTLPISFRGISEAYETIDVLGTGDHDIQYPDSAGQEADGI